ncbi:hepatocyte growth factor-regulated tyrosine kinase substrate-like isoform X2 [Artemia franciscana]|uniref:hepatocyte growth factor-regulated tyrosine kinase substrate-like isoform X2 n=1 Tax=Artemia franciscana TaxID=6661 RepID=UPI0032D9C28D
MFKTMSFERLLEKATSHLLLEPDWNAILQICDMIRAGDTQPKYAIACIKKKMFNQNPHVALLALQVLESCVKNCGVGVHEEIATKTFMEDMRDLAKNSKDDPVKNKVLELIQAWAYAFRNSSRYRAVQDTLNIMKAEGFTFGPLKESDAMFAADTAPEWVDGESCHRCRAQFSLTQRKHHCRACGQVFCGKCSSKSCALPKFGIEKEVRVCDSCWDKHNGDAISTSSGESPDHSARSTQPSKQQSPAKQPGKSEEEIKEEEDFQLALALSKSEAEEKEKLKLRQTATLLNRTPTKTEPVSPKSSKSELVQDQESENPELARYLNRSYWENVSKSKGNEIADGYSATVEVKNGIEPTKIVEKFQNGEMDSVDDFALNLRNQIEMFVNRMKSNSSRGRYIANDTSVQTLFLNITAMHSELLKHTQDLDQRRGYYETLQDKLTQARDARAALDALREEHREKLRRAAEEADRQRQMQMAFKLDIMRKKKQEYLEYQRQLAMQRIQEQEREMQLRMEQQKQMYLRSTTGYPPQGPPYIQPPVPGYVQPPQGYPGAVPQHAGNYGGQPQQPFAPPLMYGAPSLGPANQQQPPNQYVPMPHSQQGSVPPMPANNPQYQVTPPGAPNYNVPQHGQHIQGQHVQGQQPPNYNYPMPGSDQPHQGYPQYSVPPSTVQQVNQPAPSAPAPTPDIGELISFD